jgi:hypothetical protein
MQQAECETASLSLSAGSSAASHVGQNVGVNKPERLNYSAAAIQRKSQPVLEHKAAA